MTQHNDDQTAKEHLATVPEAAKLLGISPEAVRTRLSRGTLKKRKGADNTTYVVLPDDVTGSNGDRTTDRTDPESLAYRLLEDQVRFLRAELERKDTIIMSLTQRIPELEPAQEAPGASVRVSEEADSTQAPAEEGRRSWWRRLFGS